MLKSSLIYQQISDLISNQDVSDESIYIVYQFLSDLVLGFESQALGRLRRYSKEQEKVRQEMIPKKSQGLK
jgi:hypothetical protein